MGDFSWTGDTYYEIEIYKPDCVVVDGKVEEVDRWMALATRYMTREGAVTTAVQIRGRGNEVRVVAVSRTVVPEPVVTARPAQRGRRGRA